MHRKAFVGSILVGALLLTGCMSPRTPSGGAPASSSASEPSPPASASTDPQPTPTAVADQGDPMTWVVSDAGIGPYALGADLTATIAAMPTGATVDAACCPWVAFWQSQTRGGAQLVVASDHRLGPVVTVGWLPGDPSAWTGVGPRTAEGIGVGSAWASVKAAYPSAEASQLPNNGAALRVGDVWFTSRTGDVVEGIVVIHGTPWPEYCG